VCSKPRAATYIHGPSPDDVAYSHAPAKPVTQQKLEPFYDLLVSVVDVELRIAVLHTSLSCEPSRGHTL